jgi:hypothetical protein
MPAENGLRPKFCLRASIDVTFKHDRVALFEIIPTRPAAAAIALRSLRTPYAPLAPARRLDTKLWASPPRYAPDARLDFRQIAGLRNAEGKPLIEVSQFLFSKIIIVLLPKMSFFGTPE